MTQYNMETAAEQVLAAQSAYMTQMEGVADSAKGFFAAQYVADQAKNEVQGLRTKNERASGMLARKGAQVQELENAFNAGDRGVASTLAKARSAYNMAQKHLDGMNTQVHRAETYHSAAMQAVEAFEAGNSYQTPLEQNVADQPDLSTVGGIDAMFYQKAA